MSCCLANADNPGQPEYGKKRKKEQHGGCCCLYGGCNDTLKPVEKEVIKKKLQRTDFSGGAS